MKKKGREREKSKLKKAKTKRGGNSTFRIKRKGIAKQ